MDEEIVHIGTQLTHLFGHLWSHLFEENHMKGSTKLGEIMGLDTLHHENVKNYISHKRKNYRWGRVRGL